MVIMVSDRDKKQPCIGILTLLATAGAVSLGLALNRGPGQSATIAWAAQERPLAPPLVSMATAERQGTTVVLGNTSLSIPWQQRGDRVGLADIPAMRQLGLDLQNTDTAEQQPLLWFSNQSQRVPTWQAQGKRYLDLTDWARQQGWVWQPRGDRLQLQGPPSTVMAGRRGRQAGGDRLVLEVDRPTLWSLTETVDGFTLTVEARVAPTFEPQTLTSGDGSVLASLQVQTQPDRLQIQGRFDRSARPRVWSLPDPHRIVIDITQTPVVPREIQWAPGLRWRDQYLSVGGRQFLVHQLWLDLNTLHLQPIWPQPAQLPGIAPLSSTAQRWGAIAAVNAGFFNRNNQLPLGAIRSQGHWISGPILNRGAIAWAPDGRAWLSRLALTHTLSTAPGQSFPITQINSGYVEAGIGLYTPDWGRTYTPITNGEILVLVDRDQVIQQMAAETAGQGAYPIPATGYLLALRSFTTAARALPPGTSLSLSRDTRPALFETIPFAIGGGPVLVQAGRIVADAQAEGFSPAFATQAAPRSAIGVTPDGRMVLVAIHNSPGGRGPTLTEAAQLMQQLGVQDALNLDGGNSSTLYLGGSLLNRHPGTVGRVHSGLGVFETAPAP